ncbi:MAG: glycosyltransferase family 39 protein [Pseudolabrys sp.]|nr:glycosyltransferase family 39 protein [Pseudolabrys sp.]
MHYVSLIVEFLRGRPAVVFWTAALTQAALWTIVPSLIYFSPPGDVPIVLAVGREFVLGSYLGPPLAFWLGEIAFRTAGMFGVYLVAQACVVVALWTVFTLGRSIVGTRHAVLAVLLMVGIAALNVPTPDFGPAVLAMPLWGLALLHYWRALGEDARGYWFLVALDVGLLLLTNYIGFILLALLLAFVPVTARGRRAALHPEPWIALVLLAVVIFPHAAWLRESWRLVFSALDEGVRNSSLPPWAWILAVAVLSHLGVMLLALLASGWRGDRRERAPEIDRPPAPTAARIFVYYFALAPITVAAAIAAVTGKLGPLERVGPLVMLTGLALIVAAGDHVRIFRERMVSSAWLGLLVLPPALTMVGVIVLPWTLGVDLKVGQPTSAMGQFYSDNFQRRTGKPLSYVAGDTRLASLVALASPSRPHVYFDRTPERSPWATAANLRDEGAILLWPSADTAGSPPADLKSQFPEIVPELPRAFARPIEGILPLIRVGWAAVRPANTPPLPPTPRR